MTHYKSRKKAFVLLEDGTIFHGKSIGIEGTSSGELCFNTGMTGYQEIFTDPSYNGQLMVMANAHIGNYGTNLDEVESDSVKIAGFGTYKVAKRKARVGRNPRTGEQIQIAASQKVKFLPAKALKEVFNK